MSADAAYIEKVYNYYSRFYDQLFGKIVKSGRELTPLLLELSPRSQLLEVGVGTGLSIPTLPRNIEITGIDLSEKMLERARRRVELLGLENTKLLRMDAHHLDFPDNSFHSVLAAYFISTVPDPVRVILEMKRVCRPGGFLVFLNHFRSEHFLFGGLEKFVSPLCYRIGFRTDLKVHSLMEECGLAIESKTPIDFLGHWQAVRCVNP
mgnify:CR=1 FL=1